jgi:DNA-binding transcriptional LysR family regulator
MELRDLRALLAVVRTGSFTAAATELGYTQSAVSQQVAALEAELGQALLTRRPVRPTPAGERLAEHAARILLRVDVARSEVIHLERGDAEVRVAACPLAAPGFVGGALRDLRIALPSLRVTVRTMGAHEAVDDLAAGRSDVAIVGGIAAVDSPLRLADAGLLASYALSELPLAIAMQSGHPLARRRSLHLDALSDAPWVVAPSLAAGRAPGPAAVVYEGEDLPTLLDLVSAGLGSALLPLASCEGVAGIAAVPLADDLTYRVEALALRNASDVALRLVDALRARGLLTPLP